MSSDFGLSNMGKVFLGILGFRTLGTLLHAIQHEGARAQLRQDEEDDQLEGDDVEGQRPAVQRRRRK